MKTVPHCLFVHNLFRLTHGRPPCSWPLSRGSHRGPTRKRSRFNQPSFGSFSIAKRDHLGVQVGPASQSLGAKTHMAYQYIVRGASRLVWCNTQPTYRLWDQMGASTRIFCVVFRFRLHFLDVHIATRCCFHLGKVPGAGLYMWPKDSSRSTNLVCTSNPLNIRPFQFIEI